MPSEGVTCGVKILQTTDCSERMALGGGASFETLRTARVLRIGRGGPDYIRLN